MVEDGIILSGEAMIISPGDRKVLQQTRQGHLGMSKCQYSGRSRIPQGAPTPEGRAYFCRKLLEKKKLDALFPYPPMSTEQDKTYIGLVSMKTLNDSLKHGPLVKKHRPRQPLNTTSVPQTSRARAKDVPTSVNGLNPYCLYAYKPLEKSCVIQVRVFCCY